MGSKFLLRVNRTKGTSTPIFRYTGPPNAIGWSVCLSHRSCVPGHNKRMQATRKAQKKLAARISGLGASAYQLRRLRLRGVESVAGPSRLPKCDVLCRRSKHCFICKRCYKTTAHALAAHTCPVNQSNISTSRSPLARVILTRARCCVSYTRLPWQIIDIARSTHAMPNENNKKRLAGHVQATR